jgi:predicted nuclease with TOPRIM domain
VHAALAVGFALGAARLTARKTTPSREEFRQTLEENEDLRRNLEEMEGRVVELEERIDFSERLLAREKQASPADPRN